MAGQSHASHYEALAGKESQGRFEAGFARSFRVIKIDGAAKIFNRNRADTFSGCHP